MPARTSPPARRPKPAGWTTKHGGYDTLGDADQVAAKNAYKRWIADAPELARRYDLSDYVAYVQGKRAEEPGPQSEAIQASDAPAGMAAVSATSRRARLMSDLLRGHYDQSWLPDSVADRLQRVEIDRARRQATLHLLGGGKIIDHGDRLELDGPMHPDVATEMAEAAGRHGWHDVKIMGSPMFKNSLAIALAMHEPPISSDHQLSRQGQKDLAAERVRRAASAIPARNPADLRRLAEANPIAAARTQLADEQAKCRATLAGRPTGETDATAIAAPKLVHLSNKRQAAISEAAQARDFAARHLVAHGRWSAWMPTAAGRRQRALDTEAGALTREADQLNKGRRREEKAIKKEAERAAKMNREALADWTWSPSTARAETRLAALERVADDLAHMETPDVVAGAARGDFTAAIAAADRSIQDETDEENRDDPQNKAVHNLITAERAAAHDPALLGRLRKATTAAISGDEATIAAAYRNDLEGAMSTGGVFQRDWQRSEDARRKAAHSEPEHESSIGYR